jgi:16S rRNA (adenine1518-N6/adenine1519-N6)-dimethyltransferase
MNLREMCRKYNIQFKKGLGQNLLLDPNINRIMVDAADLSENDTVVEVGAGLGALTALIAERAGKLLAVEIDGSFIPCLEDQFGEMAHVKIFRGDILNHDISKLIEEYVPGGTSHKLVANLPYYITTPILFEFLESPVYFSRLIVMVQEEVGQRLVAAVGSENYGVLTVAAQLYADVDIVHRAPASCFVPRPKVDSTIVRFRCHEHPAPEGVTPKFLMSVVRAAFSQRRKTLRNTLIKSGKFGAPREAVEAAFEATAIDPGRRAQTLSIDDFKRLAQEIRRRI